ncbi:MAG TPA: tetratricopeptide repeat protein [Verrucomicrobiae bacterium]|nr:tetratricopeptide repeat protein [Verrucomicrobiae bacterium]
MTILLLSHNVIAAVAPHSFFVALLCCTLFQVDASGMFMRIETETVPIDRLLTNLSARLAKNTNDFEATYQLARVHSMAYSTNLDQVDVRKDDDTIPVFAFPASDSGVPETVNRPKTLLAQRAAMQHLTNAIILYERSILLLRGSTNIAGQRWMILPTELGLAWCLDQAGRRQQAIQAYRKALKLSWKMEVSGDFNIKQWVEDVWDDVRSERNPMHTQRRVGLGPGVCYSEEVIGYLLKLLDPVKDASEIAQLKKDQQTLATMPRAITPILIPLQSSSDFADLVNTNAQVAFDLDGSGLARKWGWLTPKAAWLVYDPKHTGEVTSGLQMFGSVTFWVFWRDGYEALRALDDNGDGVLTGAELHGLALWSDANGNGVSEPGEVIPVESLGITSLSCTSQRHDCGIEWNPAGVGFQDGTTRPSYDWIVPNHGE